MKNEFSLFPEAASTIASKIDDFYIYLTAVSAVFVIVIFFTVIYFAIKYHRKSEDERPRPVHGNLPLEIAWSVIPLIISMTMFAWGAVLYFHAAKAPQNAMEIFVVGKQWMWKIQHIEGKREINELHVPIGQPVKLTMTSEDVIHSFFIPAFRVKMDVVPGRYTQLWFEPTKVGEYHLFCAEYCGTYHSGMIGRVVVMELAAYEAWLSGNTGASTGESMVTKGEKLFGQFNCASCHGDGRGPVLQGVYNKSVELNNGRNIKADEAYLRESILNPTAKIVAGYEPIMPTYAGQINEEQVMQLTAYLKSIGEPNKAPKEALP
jgi:cytochrome c oxidase subunit II